MFDTILSVKKKKEASKHVNLPFLYDRRALMIWEEHCVECSPPTCYHNCPNYLPRKDKKCVRLLNGMQRSYDNAGLFDYGISCEFRKWAKVEGHYYGRSVHDDKEIITIWVVSFLASPKH